MSGPNPRAAAVSALVRQEQDGFSNLVLDAELKRQKLEGRDKAFASAIFYTVLEHRGTLDYILCQFLPKGLAKLDAPVREILRAALAQARYMQVPVSAAVNEAVKLTRAFKKSSASGLVNAVLRRACVYDLSKARFQNETERLMVLGSAGQDVAEFLRSRYPDEALGILTYAADGGRTSLRANPLKADVPTLCEKLNALGAAAQPGVVPGSVLAKFEGSPADNDLFRAGCYHVEGQASQLAALCVEAKPGETVLDLCAAPGGKSLHAADKMRNQGCVEARDLTEYKVDLIRENVQRAGVSCVVPKVKDAEQLDAEWIGKADVVIADLPCTGYGVIGRKPDIKYYASKEKEEELVRIQRAILANAASYVKPGGTLLYSTCTVNRKENSENAAWFLEQFPFEAVSLDELLPDELKSGETAKGQLQLIPGVHKTDGFFLAKFRKTEEGRA